MQKNQSSTKEIYSVCTEATSAINSLVKSFKDLENERDKLKSEVGILEKKNSEQAHLIEELNNELSGLRRELETYKNITNISDDDLDILGK